jgi:NAD+ kinase
LKAERETGGFKGRHMEQRAGRVRQAIIFANMDKAGAGDTARAMTAFLAGRGIASETHSSLEFTARPSLVGADLAISLGGDGTVLATARYVAAHGIPIFPVNLGNFGFITEVGRDDWESDLACYLDTCGETKKRLMIEVAVEREGRTHFACAALNDAVVSGAGISKLITLKVDLNEAPLAVYRADGMIVATPTGSTAYSAAAGGPILAPDMEAIIINPICPFTLSHRPLVLPADETILIRVERQQRAEVILTIDGQITCPVHEGDLIRIRRALRPALIAVSARRNFFDVLRAKLNWSGGPDA